MTLDDWRSWPADQKLRLRWRLTARPNQLTPPGDWLVWLILAGRGFGKTRTGAEDSADFLLSNPLARLAVVAPSFSSGRDVCLEGESGLLNVLPRSLIQTWNRSMGELVLTNGAQAKIYSSEEPENLRGPQHHRAWCDELAAWKNIQDTWDMLLMGLRLGTNPQVVITTTPKPLKLIKDLSVRPTTVITRGSTFENAANLSRAALEELKRRYEGTRLGRQELYAEVLEDVEGALWSQQVIDESRERTLALQGLDLSQVVVAVDPAVTFGEDSDDTGIIVVGRDATRPHAYVLADRTCHLSPDGWARRAVQAYHDFQADHITAESNQGGEMVRRTIHTVSPYVPVRLVTATRGKRIRAEPVAALYEQGRVHHLRQLPELEEQLTGWDPDSGTSPDRLDALVWGITDLLLNGGAAQQQATLQDVRLVGRR